MEHPRPVTAADYAAQIEPLLYQTDRAKALSARMWIVEAANTLPRDEFLAMASLLQITVSRTKKAARQELVDFVNRLWVMHDQTHC